MQGESALLLDASAETFDAEVQARIWAAAAAMSARPGIREAVPGMNNLTVVFDALLRPCSAVKAELLLVWAEVRPNAVAGRVIEVPVLYGAAHGEDLPWLAEHLRLSEAEIVRRHHAPLYSVAAVGFMPGFVYLSGLDPALAAPRRPTPRTRIAEGAVIIGGAQTGIMPHAAPSGWHVIGRTGLVLFDAARDMPSTFRPGDGVRFVPA